MLRDVAWGGGDQGGLSGGETLCTALEGWVGVRQENGDNSSSLQTDPWARLLQEAFPDPEELGDDKEDTPVRESSTLSNTY